MMQENNTKIAYSLSEACGASGVGRTRLYEEINAGRLHAVKVGRRTLIPASALEAWLKSLPAMKI